MKSLLSILFSLPLLLWAGEGNTKNKEELKTSSNLSYSRDNKDQKPQGFRGSQSPCRDINPSAWGCPGNDGFFLSADFLYWRTGGEVDLYFAQDTEVPASPIGGITTANYRLAFGEVYSVRSTWDYGFRVGTGWNTPYDSWDVGINYTWYRNKSTSNISSPSFVNAGGGIATGGWLTNYTGSLNTRYSSASGERNLKFDEGVLELGRDFYTSKFFSMRPFLGAKINRLDRRTTFGYYGGQPNITNYFIAVNRFTGYGPALGMNMDFHLDYGLNVFGKLSGAMLFGSPSVKVKTIETNFITGNSRLSSRWRNIPELQAAVGMNWGMCFNNDTMYFELGAMWEATQFFSMDKNAFPILGSSFSLLGTQDISLTGLTLNMKFDF